MARALRRWRRRWPLALLAIVTLGVAMGANTAMFSVFDAFVLHPLPFPHSTRLVWVDATNVRSGAVLPGGLSIPDYADFRAQSRSLVQMAAFFHLNATLVGRGAPQHFNYVEVTGDFFPALGVKPLLGRTLNLPDEHVAGGSNTRAVLSYGLWRQYFGGDPNIVGRTLDMDNEQVPIVGVMPPGFDYPPGTTVWTNESMDISRAQIRGWRYLSVFARLAPGASLGQAQAEMNGLALRLASTYPKDDNNIGVQVTSMAAQVAGPMAPAVNLMMIGALLVLLLACVNVGNLLLGAAVARWPEMALQMSLGATRGRLLSQLLAEGVVLAVLAAALGWLLAWLCVPLIQRMQSASLPLLAQVHLNATVLAFSVLLTLAIAVWFALAPAWSMLRSQPVANLMRAAGPQPRPSRLPAVLVVIEVAATVVLLVGAGLFWQSLRRLERTDPGFQPDHVLTFRTSLLFLTQAEMMRKEPYFTRLNEKLGQIPGVVAAGMISQMPYVPAAAFPGIAAAGTAAAAGPANALPQAAYLAVVPGYFRAMGTPVRGRTFTAADGQKTAARVVIISASVARELFPGQDALGRSLVFFWGPALTVRVVGIAADVGNRFPGDAPAMNLYFPLGRTPRDSMSAAVRVRGNPLAVLPSIRKASAQLDAQVAVWNVATLQQRLDAANAPVRYRANLLAALALLALLLAASGLYSVLAHAVAQQRHEIGVRMALGASTRRVGREVMLRALRLIAAGIVIGLLLAWWLHGSVQHLLYAGAGGEVWTWIGVPALVLVVGLLATLLPARRAARLDPVIALRCD